MKLVRLIITVTCSTGSLLSYGVTDLYPEQPKILSLIMLLPLVEFLVVLLSRQLMVSGIAKAYSVL